MEVKGKEVIFLTTLDSQKAFDVVNHQILLDQLYFLRLDTEYWTIMEDLYTGLTSTVKWQGGTSLSFQIDQGVRQGGVLSTHLYKNYINELQANREDHNIGVFISNTYVGCLTCVDDTVLLSDNNDDMPEMLNRVYIYSSDHRFLIHPVKSNTIIKSSSKQTSTQIREAGEILKLEMKI